jgi:type IV pilus assembly protein PilX
MKPVHRNRQRGAVLVIALLFLTILTILGVTAMTATTFEERLSGNTRDTGVAFQAAESALRDARRDLNGIVIPPFAAPRSVPISGKTGFGDLTADADDGSCGSSTPPQNLGLCRPFPYDATQGVPPKFNPVFSTNPSRTVPYGTFTGASLLLGIPLAQQPRYFIEVMCLVDGSIGGNPDDYCRYYRITAQGFGHNPNTQVTVQEVFLKL